LSPLFRRFLAVALVLATGAFAYAQSRSGMESTLRTMPPAQAVVAPHGMVVAQEARAARIGADILKQGGNAIDAAVAVGFALSVTYPRAGNLGGGGFMLVHLAGRNQDIAIDYRETAPAAATRDMFLDAKGEPDEHKSRDSALAVGVPGTVAGLSLALERYGSGKFTLAQLIAAALAAARNGIDVTDDTADSLPWAQERLGHWPSSAPIFLNSDGGVLTRGQLLVQADLAATLSAIAHNGPRAFYEGPIADKIAAAVRNAGGIMTADDLRKYEPVMRTPVRGTYRGYEIVSMPPPSSGGVHLIEMLNILEGYDSPTVGSGSANGLHLLVEAMRRAYADRATFLGDPDSVKVPVAGLISKQYAAMLRAGIDLKRATPSSEIKPGNAAIHEGDNTTHFSVIDADGNAVANTYTLNFSYGLGLVAAGTGVLLNNELDDFAAKPGAANAFGLIGYQANLPGPGKRPLSSMTPTFVLKDGKVVLVTGSPGGSRIITTVLQVIVGVIDGKHSLAEAVGAPRLHQQWEPDVVYVEPGFAQNVLETLAARGDRVVPMLRGGSANSIMVTPQGIVGTADPRTRGALAVGE